MLILTLVLQRKPRFRSSLLNNYWGKNYNAINLVRTTIEAN